MSKKSSRSNANGTEASSPTSPAEDALEVVDETQEEATTTAAGAASKGKQSAAAKGKKATDATSQPKETTAKAKATPDKAKASTDKAKASSAKTASNKTASNKKGAAKESDEEVTTSKDSGKGKKADTSDAQKSGSPVSKTRSSGTGSNKSRSRRGPTSKKAAAQLSRREKLRQQREAAERARKRRMRIVTGAGALVLAGVLFVVGFVLYRDWDNKRKEEAALRAVQVIPPNANEAHTALSFGVKATDPNAPTLTIYQDYQCPACKSAEDRYGNVIRALAQSGKVNVEFRTLTFLDAKLQNDSSVRSARAAACAATVGKYESYHDTIFANQPPADQEGVGYTDEQLLVTFPEQAGITSNLLTEFKDCYNRKRTYTIVNEIATNASDVDKVNSTPTYKVNGKNPKWDYTNPESGATDQVAWWQTLQDNEEAWLAAINKVATEDDNNTPTPSK